MASQSVLDFWNRVRLRTDNDRRRKGFGAALLSIIQRGCEGWGFGEAEFGLVAWGFVVVFWDCGRLLPQTIPHPIRGETAKRMGHPDLGLGDGFDVGGDVGEVSCFPVVEEDFDEGSAAAGAV